MKKSRKEITILKELDIDMEMRTKYRIVDLNKGLMAEDTYIYAKSPLQAVREYVLELMKEPKNIVRDYEGKGRFVVYGNGKSYVYKERS